MQIMTQSLNAAHKYKDRETEKYKADTRQFYTGSSHNTVVVQSPCTFKGFHCNHSGLQIAQGPFQETSLIKHNFSGLPCSRTLPKDFFPEGQLQETSLL